MSMTTLAGPGTGLVLGLLTFRELDFTSLRFKTAEPQHDLLLATWGSVNIGPPSELDD